MRKETLSWENYNKSLLEASRLGTNKSANSIPFSVKIDRDGSAPLRIEVETTKSGNEVWIFDPDLGGSVVFRTFDPSQVQKAIDLAKKLKELAMS